LRPCAFTLQCYRSSVLALQIQKQSRFVGCRLAARSVQQPKAVFFLFEYFVPVAVKKRENEGQENWFAGLVGSLSFGYL
jgi:hypothetical protein